MGGIGGDRHIHHAAQVLAASVRTGDVLARLGGDEFGIIAVGASPTQTGELACRVEGALRRAGIEACAGYAPYHPATGLPAAWGSADQAMYQRKRLKHRTRFSITSR